MSETIKIPAFDTTKTCPQCGKVGDFPREELVRQCPHCENKDDQDRIAAINLLIAAIRQQPGDSDTRIKLLRARLGYPSSDPMADSA